MYDLPNISRQQKSNAKKFRKHLIQDGFKMFQHSIYTRYCLSEENAEMHKRRIRKILVTGGKVSVIQMTDKQYSAIEMFNGKTGYNMRSAPELLIFY